MEVWTVLFPILLTDVVNPVLFAFMVYAAGSNRPVLLSSSMLLGHTTAYFSAGIMLALFMNSIAAWFANPGTIDFLIEFLDQRKDVGLVLGKQPAQVPPAEGPAGIAVIIDHAATGKGLVDLRIQIVAIGQDHEGEVPA